MTTLQERASDWQKDRKLDVGFVYIYKGKPFHWSKILRPVEEFSPNVTVLSPDGKEFISIEGATFSGAKKWEETL